MLTLRRRCGNSLVCISVSERSDGDCAPTDGTAPGNVTVLRQVHGTRVVEVGQPGEHQGVSADAAWTWTPRATLAVRTADCVPIALYGTDAAGRGAVAAVHAGWRGLLDGVVAATCAELGRHGIRGLRAVVGPHICPQHYEFGADQLDAASEALGPSVSSTTKWGSPALDLGEAARLLLRRNGAVIDSEVGRCTAADERYFSHRARGEQGRTALLVCLEAQQEGLHDR
ncbi:polyphenol oxidase family protein [Candidatus Poriferisodalis sp.]|uniref:polyphenol oxidase family protein n=1 Tax=Candidatus Poriferisodalis sp. TaxID=3101277 RepID=UPI003B01DDB8